ncbi:MAG: DNA topoisomerase 1 [Alphaproteobacteria bacterium MarineAlpha4_Bin2]|nr:MAG: DNA topoisomerase 1 [Alphaproteobacteria bacterium MarineAlpha4_Bin2]
MTVVVVESPAKAKTINKYLGRNYHVLASYGHVRDLPSKDGSVRPDNDFSMSWEVDNKSKKRIDEIAKALKGQDTLILATDPDREGEAISWHVEEVLRQRKALDDVSVSRVVFHEITKDAILEAMKQPRAINQELVDAYLARRALDYLVGFTLSPVLWRKLPGSRSAGRVQSVALRLICEREADIEVFVPQEYWSVTGQFTNMKGIAFPARLTHLNGERLDRLAIKSKTEANAAHAAIEASTFKVSTVEKKTVRRNPAPPFTTSTLQQEASRKLRFGASRTMQVAQRLYEGIDIGGETVGLITYMRTDSVTLSSEAIGGCRRLIEADFGDNYLPAKPRIYRTKAKNAQEAHEAVRPTDLFRRPADVKPYLDEDQFRLYELIWKRTLASEMESAIFDQVSADLKSSDGKVKLRANGSVLKFDGFRKLYQEGEDEKTEEDSGDRRLPELNEGETSKLQSVETDQHFTQPPPRYSEASLVKKMEELGIGRPSTYASILMVLQDRNYVKLERRQFIPEDRGRLVTTFLTCFFEKYVEYGFTAELEKQLDDISDGRLDWKKVLQQFWQAFSKSTEETASLKFSEVLDALDEDLGPHFFPAGEDGNPEKARLCPVCKEGRLSLKLGRYGAFVGCSNYPDCKYTRQLAVGANEEQDSDAPLAAGPIVLGSDPETGLDVSLRKGPYGPYIQLGEAVPADREKKQKAVKPKRASLPKGMSVADVTLEIALKLLSLPREVGPHPETSDIITAGIGRFGPYLRYQSKYTSLPDEDDVLSIGLNRAVTILAEAKPAGGRELGSHPEDDKPITVRKGRYGPYVKHGKTNATLPNNVEMDDLTLEQAVELIAAKVAKSGAKKVKVRKKPAGKSANKNKPSTTETDAALTDA